MHSSSLEMGESCLNSGSAFPRQHKSASSLTGGGRKPAAPEERKMNQPFSLMASKSMAQQGAAVWAYCIIKQSETPARERRDSTKEQACGRPWFRVQHHTVSCTPQGTALEVPWEPEQQLAEPLALWAKYHWGQLLGFLNGDYSTLISGMFLFWHLFYYFN